MIDYPPQVQYGMAGQLNPFMQGQAALGYQMNYPLYGGTRMAQSQGILDQIQGNVPNDVIDEVIQQAAQRGIGTGNRGGINAAILSGIAGRSLSQVKEGREAFNVGLAQTPVAPIWNPMSLYVPQLLGQQTLEAAQAGTKGKYGSWYDMNPLPDYGKKISDPTGTIMWGVG